MQSSLAFHRRHHEHARVQETQCKAHWCKQDSPMYKMRMCWKTFNLICIILQADVQILTMTITVQFSLKKYVDIFSLLYCPFLYILYPIHLHKILSMKNDQSNQWTRNNSCIKQIMKKKDKCKVKIGCYFFFYLIETQIKLYGCGIKWFLSDYFVCFFKCGQ